MGYRPEANDEYNGLPVDEDHEQYDKDAWKDFTPFRTGDARTHPSFSEDLRSILGSFTERPV